MRRHRKFNHSSGGNPLWQQSVHHYLGWLAVACIIASLHAGTVMLFVWLAAAWVLTRDGRPPSDSGHRNGHCRGHKHSRRRC